MLQEVNYREERVTIEGWFGSRFEVVRTVIEFVEMETPRHLINQKPHALVPVFRPRMWRYYSVTFVQEIVNAEYNDKTFLHLPTHYASLLRWLALPKKRLPNIVEEFEAEKDRLAFSDELTFDERLSRINSEYHSHNLILA